MSFFYYPLPDGAGGGGGGALDIQVVPCPIEYYEPYLLGTVSQPIETYITGGVAPYVVTWGLTGHADLYLQTYTGPTNVVFGDNPTGLPGIKFGFLTATVTDANSDTAQHVCTVILGFGVEPP